MATVIPPQSKKQKREAQQVRETDLIPEDVPHVLIRFQASDTGESIGGSIRVPGGITEKQLEELLNQLHNASDDPVPYTFAVDVTKDAAASTELIDVRDNLYLSILKPGHKSTEDFMTLVYTPRAVFKVRPITRLNAAIAGHGLTILCCEFLPNDSGRMCTGAGDSTARVWDCNTQTPLYTLVGHTNWVLCVAYSPCGTMIATGSMDNTLRLWSADDGKPLGSALTGHLKWIAAIVWEPLHLASVGELPRVATALKDGTVKVWDTDRRVCQVTMSGHTNAVSCVRWSGANIIYLGLHDKTIKAWDMTAGGKCIQTLKLHAHWVNHISLLTDYALRHGCFDQTATRAQARTMTPEVKRQRALELYEKCAKLNGVVNERMVTALDDFTMYFWEPTKLAKPVLRMLGHQKLVNHVAFLPDGRHVALSSFDNSVKLWDGLRGTFLGTMRGHVAPVYRTAWLPDNRLLVSCSKDTTLKMWDVRTRKLSVDLPGHADEVYAVDWSGDGKRVASGGKDKMVRLWSN